jgi:nucleotide-binding universal stress UspA family protein
MKRFQNILVYLRLNETDEPVIRLASNLARSADATSVRFLHTVEAVDVPPQLKETYPWLMNPLDDAARERLDQVLAEDYKGPEGTASGEVVREKAPLNTMLRLLLDEPFDLVIVGEGIGANPRDLAVKLARKAPCPVLFIPKDASGEISSVCAALDFSTYSRYVLDVGVAFSLAAGLDKIQCFHSYDVPHGYHKTGLPEGEIEQMIRDHAHKSLGALVAKVDLKGLSTDLNLVRSPLPAAALLRFADTTHQDLLVVGSRGNDAITATLLGSKAEEMILNSVRPILTVKEKGTGRSLLASLLGV